MRKEVGTSAGLLALFAFVFHNQFTPAPAQTESAAATARVGKATATQTDKGSEETANNGATERDPPDGPWSITRTTFHSSLPQQLKPCSGSNVVAPPPVKDLFSSGLDACQFQQYLGISQNAVGRVQTVIATVADPVHTRLALYTDRQIEALENGLGAANWDFGGQWLPWIDSLGKPPEDVSDRRHSRYLLRAQESIPGLLVFRRQPECRNQQASPCADYAFPNDFLFLFVVPETPMVGINARSFINALTLASALSTGDRQVGLLTPTFSGSFFSLAQLLLEWQFANPEAASKLSPDIYSGTASAFSGARAFEHFTKLRFRIYSGVGSSWNFKEAFEDLLRDYQISPTQAAYIVEGETGFSRDFISAAQPADAKDHGIDTFVFPREISHLRNAYLEETGRSASAGSPETPSSLNFSLKDPNVGEDSVPNFDELHTPVSQSAALEAIIQQLRRKQKRIVYLTATNVLDLLFVTRSIRREAPDVRVLVGNPDVLFIPQAGKDSLVGTLFLSTYPMSLQAEEWMNSPNGSARNRYLFPSPDFQGLYNATQLLLTEIKAGGPTPLSCRLRSYLGVSATQSRPGLWLLSLTRSGLMPVEYTPAPANTGHSNFKLLPVDVEKDQARLAQFVVPAPPFSWFVAVGLVILVTAFTCSVAIATNLRSVEPRFLHWFSLRDENECNEERCASLFAGLLALSATAWILLLPACLSFFQGSSWGMLFIFQLLLVMIVVMPAGTMILLWRNAFPGFSASRALGSVLSLTFLYVLFCIGWWAACAGETSKHQLFRYRALEIYSGSSAALPLTLLCSLLSLQFLLRFKQFTKAGAANRPQLSLKFLDILPLHFYYEKIGSSLKTAPVATFRAWTLLSLVIAVLGSLFLHARGYLSSFEPDVFNWLIAGSIVLFLLGLTCCCYDFVRVWSYLYQFLHFVEILPLRSSFLRVTTRWARRPVWSPAPSSFLSKCAQQSVGSAHNWAIASECESARGEYAALRAAYIAMLPKEGTCPLFAAPAASPSKQDFEPKPTRFRCRLKAFRAYQFESCRLSSSILEHELLESWKSSINDSLVKKSGLPEVKEDRLLYGADFVALQFISYVVYVCSHVQRLARCLYLGLLLLVLVLISYSPQAPMVVARSLAVVFVITSYFVIRVFVEMERNPILSYIAKTKAGELNRDFWFRIIGFGGPLLLGIISHLVPSLSAFLFQWIAPGMESLH